MWDIGFGGRTEPARVRCCSAARLLALGGSRRGLGDGFGTAVEGQILRMEGVQVVNLCVTFPAVIQSSSSRTELGWRRNVMGEDGIEWVAGPAGGGSGV